MRVRVPPGVYMRSKREIDQERRAAAGARVEATRRQWKHERRLRLWQYWSTHPLVIVTYAAALYALVRWIA
jgi:hypothetical protein